MPHKKAKRSIRERESQAKGHDLAPAKQALAHEAVPKSLARVLNASRVREEHHRKRKSDGEDGEGKGPMKRRKMTSSEMKIRPGESIQHFNKRVEDDMRPLVKAAVQSSNAVIRHAKKGSRLKNEAPKWVDDEDANDCDDPSPPSRSTPVEPKEFQSLSTSLPRRLNDIAQAPPEIKALPRGASQKGSFVSARSSKADNVISMAQRAMMELERDKAIKRYREMKAAKTQATSKLLSG